MLVWSVRLSHATLVLVWPGHESWEVSCKLSFHNSHANSRFSTLINSHANSRFSTLMQTLASQLSCKFSLLNSYANSRFSTLMQTLASKLSCKLSLLNSHANSRFSTLMQTLATPRLNYITSQIYYKILCMPLWTSIILVRITWAERIEEWHKRKRWVETPE
jgi:hypothetical protein